MSGRYKKKHERRT